MAFLGRLKDSRIEASVITNSLCIVSTQRPVRTPFVLGCGTQAGEDTILDPIGPLVAKTVPVESCLEITLVDETEAVSLCILTEDRISVCDCLIELLAETGT